MAKMLVLFLLPLFSVVSAFPYLIGSFPNSERVPNPCWQPELAGTNWAGVGHRRPAGGGTRNPFGEDFHKVNFEWNECICRQDSDGDGKTNGEELGDPNCDWTPGMEPPRATELSHPGICEPLDSVHCREINHWLDCPALLPFDCPAFDDAATSTIDLQIDPAPVPAQDTTYVCTAFTLPDELATMDLHMIGADVIVGNPRIIHHILVYGCADDVTDNVTHAFGSTTECGGMVTDLCPELIYSWAYGIGAQCFSDEYGIRLGANGFKTAVLEFHWNNPNLLENEFDDSGIKLYYTTEIRPYDAQSLFFGPLYLELPPGQSHWVQKSTCPGTCISSIFGGETVYIPQIIPHMHYLGRAFKVWIHRAGGGREIVLNRDPYDYDDPYPKIFNPPLELGPWDSLEVECTFDTTSRDEFVYWGDATNDEMCIAITTYYPRQANSANCWGDDLVGNCEPDGEEDSGEDDDDDGGFDMTYVYGQEYLSECLENLMPGPLSEAFWGTLLVEWYPAMQGGGCDLRGIDCYDSCKPIIEEIKDNVCFQHENRNWTKQNVVPYGEILVGEVPQLAAFDFSTRGFIQALASCDHRHGNLNDDDDHDHPDDGECPFDPPPPTTARPMPPSGATVATAGFIALLTSFLALLVL